MTSPSVSRRSFTCFMMPSVSLSFVSIILTVLLENVNLEVTLPDCQDKGITFTAEPSDVEVGCGSDDVAVFSCRYEGTPALPQWIINSTVYSSNSQLPPDHFCSAHILRVTNIQLAQNRTTYQCQLALNTGCAYRSKIGQLITKCDVLDVQCIPHYLKKSKRDILKSVHTTVTQVDNYKSFYTMNYSDYNSGRSCAFASISSSSCVGGTCSNTVNFLTASKCPSTTDISITVSISDSFAYGYFPTSKSIKIDAVNNFIQVSFDDVATNINLKFLNQLTEAEKFYNVKYDPASPGCKDLSQQTRGHLINSNYISVELNVSKDNRSEICFSVIVSNGVKTISVEGTHLFASTISSVTLMAAVSVTTCTLVVCLSVICVIFNLHHTMTMRTYGEKIKETHCESFQILEKETSLKDDLDKIDLSTTSFKLCTVSNDCTMSEFASNHDPPFEPHYGFGYYKITHEEVKDVQPHKTVLLMEHIENKGPLPKFRAKKPIIQHQSEVLNGRDIYVQDKSSNQKLLKGTSFLYCARSKVLAAYWKKFPVTKECTESTFLRENISGYQPEWICYGYFQFTKPEYIKPNQRIIVIKKASDIRNIHDTNKKEDDKLVTGPGIRNLINAMGDGSTETQPPNLEEHSEWQHVFLQSNGTDMMLTEGTQYLFCAAMDRIDTHYSIHEVPEDCDDTILSFGRRHIPGFKSESGYGYFEFTEPEYLKLNKNVILMDKKGNLFTGAGAKFFYTGLKYDKDKKLRKSKVSPTSLNDTEWKHIFIQSHSKTRRLQPKMKFLYCEYKTPTPHLN